MSDNEMPANPRGTFVWMLLTGMIILFTIGFLTVATAGWFLLLLAVVAGISAFAGIHYLLWGWMMQQSAKVASDDEDYGEKAPTQGWPLPDSDRFTRF
jgi:hypothetical protein